MTDGAARGPLPPFTFAVAQRLDALDTGWRPFPGHYLLYAASGAFQLEVAEAQWLLPPHRAALIAADVPIWLRSRGAVASNSVLFARELLAPGFSCRVFTVTPLVREMLRHSVRWGMGRDPSDAAAERFFGVLADQCLTLAERPDDLWLPRPRSPELGRATDYILASLAEPLQLADVARQAGVSERTLARRFVAETRMGWRQYVGRARMVRATELLGASETPVIEVAYAVGFASVSAFSTAFRRFSGETPSGYRQRLARAG